MGSEFPEWVAALGSVGKHVLGIGEAAKNRRDDAGRAQREKDHFDRQRAPLDPEWSGLLGEWGAPQFAPPAITAPDPFETMSHQQIYDKLHGCGIAAGVQAGQINAAASGWRALTDSARQASEEYVNGVTNDIQQKWTGRAGQAAIDGTKAFAQSFHTLAACFQVVAHGLNTIEAHLSQAKASVGKPDDTTWGDELIDALPGQNFLKGPSYRASEAQAQARWVMTTYYRPGAADVDAKTPVLPTLHNPVAHGPGSPTDSPGPHTPNSPGQPSVSPDPTGPSGAAPPSPSNPEPYRGSPTGDPSSTVANPRDTAPAGSHTPADPEPTHSQTTPAGLGSPATPAENPSGGPPLVTPGVPGKSPAPPTTGTPPTIAHNPRPATITPGTPSGALERDEQDSEHRAPDYLVRDRGTELLGDQPPALPPGGVIGE